MNNNLQFLHALKAANQSLYMPPYNQHLSTDDVLSAFKRQHTIDAWIAKANPFSTGNIFDNFTTGEAQ